MGRPYSFGPLACALAALLVLPLLPAAAQTAGSGDLIARTVERTPPEIERGIPTGLHGLVRGGASAFLRSAGDEHVGEIDYSFAAGLLYQFTPSVGIAVEQHVASYPAGRLDYNATVLAVHLGLPARRVTPTLSLGVRSARGDDIDRFGGWIGLGLDWKINRKAAVTPVVGTTPVDAGSGVAGLSMLGAGLRLHLIEGAQPALISTVSYPDTLWRDEQATFTVAFDSLSSSADRIQWRFSDGRIARGDTVRHAFPRPGPHLIELTTTNGAGSAAAELIVEVFDRRLEAEKRLNARRAAGDDERAPINAQIVGRRELQIGEYENFRVRVPATTRRPLRFEWDMGDGTPAEGNNVAHAYERSGLHVVTVTVSNQFGRAVYEALVNVQVPPDPPPGFIPREEPIPPPQNVPEEEAGPPPAFARSALYSTRGIDWDVGGFTILTATRLDRASAERIALEHHRTGYRTGIMVDDDETGGSPAFRVILGQFANLPAATAALRTVQANGITGIIVDIAR